MQKIKKNKKEAYPDIEKEVPTLLQPYASKFNSWPEVLENQKKLVLDFISSDRYKKIKIEQYKSYFPEKNDTEINSLVSDIIQERIKKINKAVITYKKFRKFLSSNKDSYGGYKDGHLFIDTTKMVSGSIEEDGFYNDKVEMFAFAHEYIHATQLPDLMSAPTLIEVLNLLANSNSKYKEYFSKLTKKENTDDLDIDDAGLVSFFEYETRYLEIPYELVCFFGEIMTMLHVISQTKKTEVQFDMTKDDFAPEHLEFLKNNKAEIFVNYKSKNSPEEKNILDELLGIFGDEAFIKMMNRCF